jgi:GTP cyclohydrolase IA
MPVTEESDLIQTPELPGAVDLPAAERAAAALMRALGMDLTEPGLAQTPGRIARAYAELLTHPTNLR